MSTFTVNVLEITEIFPIEGADFIEIAKVADYFSVTKKGQFNAGDLAVYIPEASILPDYLLEKLGLTGKLAGKNKNRVKAKRLRNFVSQGILLPVYDVSDGGKVVKDKDGNYFEVVLGQDVKDELGIIKYEPVILPTMSGQMCSIGENNVVKFDIENIKRFPELLDGPIEVVITEKIHGSFTMFGYVPSLNNSDLIQGNKFAASKGLGAKGLVFVDTEENLRNIYLNQFKKLGNIFEKLETVLYNEGKESQLYKIFEESVNEVLVKSEDKYINKLRFHEPIYFLGEVFGRGVQDLTYNLQTQEFRLFDIYLGYPDTGNTGRYLNVDEKLLVAEKLGLKTVPILYRGPFSKHVAGEFTKGQTVVGQDVHIREGVVITPVEELYHPKVGRVILKSISEDYLFRANGTEFN